MNWSAIGAILLACAVGLGAFGAHGLRDNLDEYAMGVYEKAVFYHFVHALGMFVAPLVTRTPSGANRACWLLLAGVLLFSGSLYLLAITGVRTLGMVTPFGGVAFIAAWFALAWDLLRIDPRI